MELTALFRSVLEQDRSPVVLCDLNHTILYMNPSAIRRYASDGGEKLIGQSLMPCHPPQAQVMIEKVLTWFAESREHNIIYTFRNSGENKDVYMVALRDDAGNLIGYYEKHEYRDQETAALYDFI